MSAESESSQVDVSQNVPVLDQASLRHDLIATAVKFLQNPKVQSSPLEQKKSFLKKKGLTNEEIEKAVSLADVSSTSNLSSPIDTQLTAIRPTSVVPPPTPVSGWTRVREYSSVLVIIAGVVYGLYSLYKKYIEPVFLKQQKEQEKKVVAMEKTLDDFNTNISKNLKDLHDVMEKLQERIIEQNTKITDVSANLSLYKESIDYEKSGNAVTSLRGDIASLKGLLLNAKQFPATPLVQSTIPSWQLQPTNLAPSSSTQTSASALPSSKLAEEPPVDNQHALNLASGPMNVKSESSPGEPKLRSPADLEQSFSDSELNGICQNVTNGLTLKPDATDQSLNEQGDHNYALRDKLLSSSVSQMATQHTDIVETPQKPAATTEVPPADDDSEID